MQAKLKFFGQEVTEDAMKQGTQEVGGGQLDQWFEPEGVSLTFELGPTKFRSYASNPQQALEFLETTVEAHHAKLSKLIEGKR